MSPIISGGNVIQGNIIPGAKRRVTYLDNAVPTDALVAGSTGRTPVNGELAENLTTGYVYQRTGVNTWTRIDT